MKQSYLHLGTDKNSKVIFVKVSAYGEKPTKNVWLKFQRYVKGADTLHSIPVMLHNRQSKHFSKFEGAIVNDMFLRAIVKEYSK